MWKTTRETRCIDRVNKNAITDLHGFQADIKTQCAWTLSDEYDSGTTMTVLYRFCVNAVCLSEDRTIIKTIRRIFTRKMSQEIVQNVAISRW